MRYLAIIATVLLLGMTGATAWVITQSPGMVDELTPTPAASTPGPTPTPVIVSIEQGEGVKDISEELEEVGVVDSAIQFRVLVQLLGYDKLLQAGEYEFDPGTPTLDVVYRMRRGEVSPLSVTVVEGWRLEQIADAVDAQGAVTREEFLDAAVAGNFPEFDFTRRLISTTALEGYLFPATYFYGRADSAQDLIRNMLETMDERFGEEMRSQALDQGLTMHAALTIASIVEREARVAEERPIIAQVFLKRLRQGIPLEADPTVQYALAEAPDSVAGFDYWKEALTEEDLEVDSPYNTYRAAGLPPTPIAAPRLESIEAVIEPADTNYLYFVAKPDGSHAFAETLDEHLDNLERYAR